MDMMTRMMDQMQSAAAQAAKTPAQQGKKADGKDFDKMVRQKQKEVRKPKAEEKKPEAREQTEAQNPQDAQKPEGQEPETVNQQQYALAAAMLYQMQPNADNVKIQMPEEAPVLTAEQGPEIVTEVQTVTAAPETPVVTERPVETDRPVDVEFHEVLETVDRPVETVEISDAPVERAAEHVELHTEQTEETDTQEVAPELVQQEAAPVFQQVDVTPVKVAEAPQPVPLDTEEGMEQLSARIDSFLVSENGTETLELTLTPASLGTVKVEIVHAPDGALHVHLNAGSERAMNLLSRGSEHLQNLLTTDARPNVTVTVRGNSETQQQYLNPNGDNPQQQHGQNGRQQSRRQSRERSDDFVQQLRLGLAGGDEG